jgi:hypothetical protein
MAFAWWIVPCLPFPDLLHIYFLFTVRLWIFHVCRNKNFCNGYLGFYWNKWFYIWYVALAWWLVPCLPFPGLLHIYFLFRVRLWIFHVCRNKNFCNRYLSFYWKKGFYIWYMAFAWWIVPFLPFPGLRHIYFLFTMRLRIFHVCVLKTFVTDISASTGSYDFIFDIWLLHDDLYRVSPFQVYCTSTSCLPCDLEFFMFAVMKIFVAVISDSTGRNDFIFDIWLLHGDLCLPFPGYSDNKIC